MKTKKNYIIPLYFILYFFCTKYNIFINCQGGCDRTIRPREARDCLIQKPEKNGEECCYLYAQPYGNLDYEKECINLKEVDTTTNENLETVIGLLTQGSYWKSGDDPYVEVKEITCKNSHYIQSNCEAVIRPDSFSSCQDQETSESSETCCYLNGIIKGGDKYRGECVDIKSSDIPKLKEIKELIGKGEYWPYYKTTYDSIVEFRCTQPSKCETTDYVRQYYDCSGRETEKDYEECCFLYAELEGEESYHKECVDISKSYTETNKNINEVVSRLTQGTFWDKYTAKYVKIKELTCEKSAFVKSECEEKEPNTPEDCFMLKSEWPTDEVCCYFVGIGAWFYGLSLPSKERKGKK